MFSSKLEKSFIAILLSVVLLIILMQSPLNPFYEDVSGRDSWVFQYVAFAMSKGGVPYKDIFDHKGPLIYIFNYIGQLISFPRGVWFVELLFMLAFLTISYKTARLWCSRWASLTLVVLVSAPLKSYFNFGNYIEEYAMAFIAAGIYIFLDFFLNNRVSKLRLVICGLCFGAVVLLRVNVVAIWVVFSLGVLIKSMAEKDGKLPSYLGWFLAGFMIILLPTLIWLFKEGALRDFFDDYILFNFRYTSGATSFGICKTLGHFLINGITLGAIAILVYFLLKRRELFANSVYLATVIFSLLSISVSGRTYGHYGMAIVPLLIYPYARLYSGENEKNSLTKLLFTFALIVLAFGYWQKMGDVAYEKFSNYVNGIKRGLTQEQRKAINLIKSSTTEDEKIIVLGNTLWYNLLTERLAASKYAYQLPPAAVDQKIRDEFIEEMKTNQPRVVVVPNQNDEALTQLFVNKESYSPVYSFVDGNWFTVVYLCKNEFETSK